MRWRTEEIIVERVALERHRAIYSSLYISVKIHIIHYPVFKESRSWTLERFLVSMSTLAVLLQNGFTTLGQKLSTD